MKRFLGPLVVAMACIATPALAADPTGTWKWSTERNGQKMETTLKLKLEDDKLTGTISGRGGQETEISDGKLEGDEVSFNVVREFNGNKFTIAYKGKVEADVIKGTIEMDRQGEKVTRDWEAKKE